MNNLLLAARLDITESLRARWFLVYSLVFGGLIVVLFMSGVTDSRVMGFTGLSRLLLTYIQLCMGILPIFILLTTVRSIAGDRESGIFEYLLSLPISLASWFWGKLIGRFFVVFVPVFISMLLAIAWGASKGVEIPWTEILFNTGFLTSLAACFLGVGMLISSLARSHDVAQGIAFLVWLTMLLFIDLILIGLLIASQVNPDTVVAIALINPLQVFRTASMLLFDPSLMLMGPASHVILDTFGRELFLIYAMVYPVLFGLICAGLGYQIFKRSDL